MSRAVSGLTADRQRWTLQGHAVLKRSSARDSGLWRDASRILYELLNIVPCAFVAAAFLGLAAAMLPWVKDAFDNALVQRHSGTRFPYLRWVEEARNPAVRQKYIEPFLFDMRRSQPRYFVLTQPDFPWPDADFIRVWKSLADIHD